MMLPGLIFELGQSEYHQWMKPLFPDVPVLMRRSPSSIADDESTECTMLARSGRSCLYRSGAMSCSVVSKSSSTRAGYSSLALSFRSVGSPTKSCSLRAKPDLATFGSRYELYSVINPPLDCSLPGATILITTLIVLLAMMSYFDRVVFYLRAVIKQRSSCMTSALKTVETCWKRRSA